MYLDKNLIKEPPKGGWPSITPQSMRGLGKTKKVISLLRHLPYIDSPCYDEGPNVLPNCMFADWKARVEEQEDGFQHGSDASEVARMSSEGASNYENVPPHVIGLTWDPEERYCFLLDTRLGIIHWVQCDHYLRDHSSRPPIREDPYDYAPENEADTFRDAGTWAIPDFFRVLKEQYRSLTFLPYGSTRVCDVKAAEYLDRAGKNRLIEGIFRQHGWPNMQDYRKADCLKAIRSAMVEHNYPTDEW
ncbi:hypothetical protein VCV18_004714 [Metarhizium anisopliae]